ncbi:MAG: RluA family pseudouridine synthase [Zoogloeaceae bacterium]|nr:RluA family pseudouridine synthase [Zoogloeaceae bacterium]
MSWAIEDAFVNDGADYSSEDSSAFPAELTIPIDFGGLRLDQALARLFPRHSRSRVQTWVREGWVTLNDQTVDPKRKVWGGERLRVAPDDEPDRNGDEAEDIALEVVHEDLGLIVIDKPVGLVVHPGNGVTRGTLLNGLLHRFPELRGLPRAGIVHRLDKDTSGLLVVARTLEAQTDLVRQLQSRTVKRVYLAVVNGHPPMQGTIDAPIGRHPYHRTRMAVIEGGRDARTHFQVLERFDGAALVECRLETGRTHQIRVHLTHLGHPLVGDATYRRRTPSASGLADFSRQALHAHQLALVHPLSRLPMEWTSPLPADFADLLRRLRGEG